MSLISSFIDGLFGITQQENEIAYKENQALLEHNWNIQDWMRQNEYNTPANQMMRFARAGLNPNLIYSQNNTAGNISPTSMPNVNFRNPFNFSQGVQDMISSYLQFKDLQSTIKLKQAQTDNVEAQTSFTKEQVNSEAIKRTLWQMQADNQKAQKDHVISQTEAQQNENSIFLTKWALAQQKLNNEILNVSASTAKTWKDFFQTDKNYNLAKGQLGLGWANLGFQKQKHQDEMTQRKLEHSDEMVNRTYQNVFQQGQFEFQKQIHKLAEQHWNILNDEKKWETEHIPTWMRWLNSSGKKAYVDPLKELGGTFMNFAK